MNYSIEEILTRMQNGETPEAIANEVAKNINEAINQKKAKDAEKVRADERAADMQDILDLLMEYFKSYYPEVDLSQQINVKEAVALVDSMVKGVTSLQKVTKKFKDSNPDAVFAQWLEDMNF